MPVDARDRFEAGREIRIARRKPVSAPKVVERAPVVADAAVRAAEPAEEIGVLAGVPFDVGENRERLFRLPPPRQHGRETDARVYVRGMLAEHRAEPGF